MKRNIRLTETNLTRLIKRVISEELKNKKISINSKKTVDENILNKLKSAASSKIISPLAKTAKNNLSNITKLNSTTDDFIKKVVPSNLDPTGQFIKSASGKLIPITQLDDVLKHIKQGGNIDDVAKYLPGKLADGKDFRSTLQQQLSKNVPQNVVKNNLNNLSKIGSTTDNFINDVVSKNLDPTGKFIKSASGKLIPLTQLDDVLKYVKQGGNIDDVANYLPSKLADGKDFRSTLQQQLSKKQVGNAVKATVKNVDFDSLRNQFRLPNCKSGNFCDYDSSLKRIMNIIPSNTKFIPSEVKVLQKTRQNFIGRDGLPAFRDVIEVELKNGKRTLFYSSSGSNLETTGKKAGEWFIIPGWADDGWFFKTHESVALTKGGNQYLTDMAKFLEMNGIGAL